MTIALDTEIVASRYDAAARTNHYTIARDGKHWTVAIPDAHLNAHGPIAASKQKRRDHLGRLLMQAMQGPSDEDKA